MSISVLEAPKKQNEMAVIADKIDTGLIAFEERKAELTKLKEEAHGLKITSIDDKVSINHVSTIRKKLKSSRVEIEKEGKAMRDPLTRISKMVSEKEKELVSIIEPTEKELLDQEKWVEAEHERIRLEAEEKEKARIQSRIDKLAAYGFAIDYTTIMAIDDTTFETVLNNAKIEHEKDLAAKAEEQRLQKLESERLIAERAELEKLRAEQAKAQAIIEENNERIRKEQQAKEAAIRAEQQKIESEKKAAEMERQRIQREKQRAIELEQERLLERQRTAGKARFEILSEIGITNESAVNLGSMTYDDWNVMYSAYKKSFDTKQQELFIAKMKAEKEAKELALQREAALRPDKEKLQAFVMQLGSLTYFETSDEKVREILEDVCKMISNVQSYIHGKINEL